MCVCLCVCVFVYLRVRERAREREEGWERGDEEGREGTRKGDLDFVLSVFFLPQFDSLISEQAAANHVQRERALARTGRNGRKPVPGDRVRASRRGAREGAAPDALARKPCGREDIHARRQGRVVG